MNPNHTGTISPEVQAKFEKIFSEMPKVSMPDFRPRVAAFRPGVCHVCECESGDFAEPDLCQACHDLREFLTWDANDRRCLECGAVATQPGDFRIPGCCPACEEEWG